MDDLAARPGTYFNPQTEVLVFVDDSTSIDSEIFNMEAFEGADWVLISDDVPVDEAARDEILENFQATYRGEDGRAVDDDLDDEEDEDADDEPPATPPDGFSEDEE
jgi:hypothetical protein